MKVIKQNIISDVQVTYYTDYFVVKQDTKIGSEHRIILESETIPKLIQALSEHESVTSDFLLDLYRWKIMRMCESKHDFEVDFFGFNTCTKCSMRKEDIIELNKRFGESDG